MSSSSANPFHTHPWASEALRTTKHKVFWTDSPDAPSVEASLKGQEQADLVIVGGGLTGLWTALHAIEENPNRKIILLEAQEVGFGASTRNGGMCDASITHGIGNGLTHWKKDYDTLHRMGQENILIILDALKRHNIDASVEQTGYLLTAIKEWQIPDVHEEHELNLKYGEKPLLLEKETVKKRLNSPMYLAGLKIEDGSFLINPAKLVWGLKAACQKLGVRFFEYSKVLEIERNSTLSVRTEAGSVVTDKVVIATNAWAEPGSFMKKYIIPIYDHVLVTEPLTDSQMQSIGWQGREGLEDFSYQFHYSRLTADNRILWGGYDAIYYRNNGIGFKYENQGTSFNKIAAHFFHTFPQLEGLKFTHKWSGPIGMTSKFAAAFGTKHNDKVAWAAGYTGLGVGTSCWAARVALDLVDGKQTERTALKMVRKKPMPFPPAPFRNAIVQYTRRKIAVADENNGKRGLWLRLLDTLGVGFDS